ncbi:MAG: 4-(cytidine 5'-diphospho)-2-C-methyl-D-erythritol kinase [Desulfuromonadales bacterium]|nr:4-(cytidine 5'-diphospho)-2-C-methyl-D-erythritol kinase [Desulfuromonadales bacterium]MDT8423363.1 4-(cytidine 5'-diphospho)-2-C-methyl-D-erythritol kinase [Desulfuromonadales bacterium]
MNQAILKLQAPAKINLCLHVLGKRPDGYHELAMLMQRVSLYDEITLELTAEPGVNVVCDGLVLAAGEENIAARAAQQLLEINDHSGGIRIVIDKHIPVAAGLGGGSSDAATVLTGLNQLLGLGLSRAELMRIGVKLGADVPFFIFGKTAWATGIGDRLQAVAGLPDVCYLLVNPKVAVATKWVYENLVLTSKNDAARLPRFSGQAAELIALLHNDLEAATLPKFPQVKIVKDRLLAAGAQGVLMSGSGATVFGVYPSRSAADAAAEELRGATDWRVFSVQPI